MSCLAFRFRLGTVAAFGTALLLLGAPAAHAQFTENFDTTGNGANPATFGNDTGGFFVSNPTGVAGAYQSDQSQLINISTIVAPGFTDLTDVTLTFDLLNAQDAGAVLRSDAAGANAVVLVVRPAIGDMYFIPRSSGNFVGSALGYVNLSVLPGSDLRVNFSSSGNSFSASVASLSDPNTVLQSINYTFGTGAVAPSGRAGVYQFGGQPASLFDNVSITSANAAAPEPGTLALALPAVSGLAIAVVRRRKQKPVRERAC
jgi:hypothetical protein